MSDGVSHVTALCPRCAGEMDRLGNCPICGRFDAILQKMRERNFKPVQDKPLPEVGNRKRVHRGCPPD